VADTTTDGILNRVRLLEDFFQHEVRELPAFNLFCSEFHFAICGLTVAASIVET